MGKGSLLGELQRRRVFRVAAAYAVVAWLVIQVADVAFEAFEVPDGGLRLVIILALVGFPVALALAWAFDITPAGIERTESAPGTRADGAPASRPRALAAALVVLAAIAASALTFMKAVDGRAVTVQGDPRKSIVVLPFENLTGRADLAYLEDGAMNLLGLALSHWDDMRVFDDERTRSLLSGQGVDSASRIDFDVAVDVASQAGVGTLVLGELRLEGDSLAVEGKVYDLVSGDRVATSTARVPATGDPRDAFNRLAAAILQISGAPPGERPDLLAQTTRSLDAYRAYLDGNRALQLFQTDSARSSFLRAVELDSTFALAYLRLRDVNGWAGIEGDPELSREYIAKAAAHSDGLPQRYASLVRFHEAYAAGRFTRARALATEMIERDSTDAEAWYQLGEAHFHDRPGMYPHPDTLGDFTSALRAFRRTLELDSAYVLAYQHVIDVLASCAANAPWLCLDDRTAYARNDSLVLRFGLDRVEAIRAGARSERIEAAHAWVAAAPASLRARSELMERLLEAGRLEEVDGQIAILRARGEDALAAAWESRHALRTRDYASAARAADEVVRDPAASRNALVADPEWLIAALLGGGRLQSMTDMLRGLLELVPGDGPVTGPDDISYPRPMFRDFQQLSMEVAVGGASELIAQRTQAWLDALDGEYEPASVEHRARWLNSGSTVLGAYLISRDTTLLTRYMRPLDPNASRSRRTMAALLAWERDDIETARASLEAHFVRRDDVEIRGDPGIVRLFGWASLLEAFGRTEEAAAAYALAGVEATPRTLTSYTVRAWHELGRLNAELGRDQGGAGRLSAFRRGVERRGSGVAAAGRRRAGRAGDPGDRLLKRRFRGVRRGGAALAMIGCLVGAPRVHAQDGSRPAQEPIDDPDDPIPYSVPTGEGLSSTTIGDQSATLFLIRPRINLRNWRTSGWGLRLRIGVQLSTEFEGLDLDPDEFRLAAVVPGIEAIVPLGTRALLVPFLDTGVGRITRDKKAWVWGTGLKSELIFPWHAFELGLEPSLEYVAALTDLDADDDGVGTFSVYADARHPLWFKLGSSQPDVGAYVRQSVLWQPLEVGADEDRISVTRYTEAGVLFGFVERPKIWFFKLPTIGIGYRFGQVRGLTIRIGGDRLIRLADSAPRASGEPARPPSPPR